MKKKQTSKRKEIARLMAMFDSLQSRLKSFSKMAFAALWMASSASASEFPHDEAQRIANAIWRAEGGLHAATPYGVRGATNHAHARATVLRIISERWQSYEVMLERGTARSSFIEFVGERYAPPHAHHLNRNWARNVAAIYRREKNFPQP